MSRRCSSGRGARPSRAGARDRRPGLSPLPRSGSCLRPARGAAPPCRSRVEFCESYTACTDSRLCLHSLQAPAAQTGSRACRVDVSTARAAPSVGRNCGQRRLALTGPADLADAELRKRAGPDGKDGEELQRPPCPYDLARLSLPAVRAFEEAGGPALLLHVAAEPEEEEHVGPYS